MAGNTEHEHEIPVTGEDAGVEVKDRGLFDFLGKKEEAKPQEEVIATEFEEKVQVSEPVVVHKEEEEKKGSLLEKLHRSGSSSSSSSDEEDEEKKKKKREKKGLKQKLKEKMSGEKEEDKKPWELETNQAVSAQKKHDEDTLPGQADTVAPVTPEAKKGLMEKIKDKLPGQHKKPEEISSPPPPPPAAVVVEPEYHVPAETTAHDTAEPKEKKGFLEKIKEKLPGYHPKTEEEKEKEKEKGTSE